MIRRECDCCGENISSCYITGMGGLLECRLTMVYDYVVDGLGMEGERNYIYCSKECLIKDLEGK